MPDTPKPPEAPKVDKTPEESKQGVKEKFAKLAEESNLGEKKEAIEEKREENEREREANRLERKCNDILEDHGGLEGNIPVHNEYWNLRNQIRGLRKPF